MRGGASKKFSKRPSPYLLESPTTFSHSPAKCPGALTREDTVRLTHCELFFCLQELIQNAEDAGATEVKFLFDKSSYGIERLHEPSKTKRYQGPALFAYNNAKFTSADWRGIRMLDDSVKVDDPMKVGRFGLGFKSVFHLTGTKLLTSLRWTTRLRII